MLTRSKAVKRAAEDEISTSPTKSPRRSAPTSNNASGNDNRTPFVDANAPEGEALNGVQSENENQAPPDGLRDVDKNAAGGETGGGSAATDVDQMAAPNKLKEQKETATQFLLQLLLLLEKRRVMKRGTTLMSAQPGGMLRLFELLADPNLAMNPYLDALPSEFIQDIGPVAHSAKEANQAKERLGAREAEVVPAGKAYNDALVQRSFAMLEITDNSEEAMRAHNATVAEAWEALKAARAARDEAKEEWEILARGVDWDCAAPFAKAEASLVAARQLVPAPGNQQDENQDNYSPRAARSDSRSCGQSRRREERAQREQRDENQDGHRNRAERASSRGSRRQDERRRSTGAPPCHKLIRQMQDDKQRLMEDARRHLCRMEKKFDGVRNHYYYHLDNFLHDKDAGRDVGTRSDFDRKYYLERKEANHRLTLAQQAWEFALGEADETDALTREQRVRYLDDWDESDHGEHEGNEHERDLIWEATEQVIEAWLDDEGMRETRSARHWHAMQEHKDEGGQTVGELEEIELRLLLATGRQRRLIDGWQAEQRRARLVVEAEIARAKADEQQELPWWQAWDGI